MRRTVIFAIVAMLAFTASGLAQDAPAPPDEPALQEAELDERIAAVREQINQVLAHYAKTRPLNTRDHSAWEAMHIVLAYGVKTPLRVGGPGGESQTAIGWLCFSRSFKGERILTVQDERPRGVVGGGLQGHEGQLLAVLAQARLRREYPMWTQGRNFTVEDLIEGEKLTCRPGQELTFKLIGLSHYLPSDATWKCNNGQQWSMQRLLSEEIAQPIQGAACGGTHRLTGLSYAVRNREKEGKPMVGEFKRADLYLRAYHRYAFKLRNDDGSLSTRWLESREARDDPDRRLLTSGHTLEWLAYSLDKGDLRKPEMVAAVEYLSGLLWSHRHRHWGLGALGHALHALAIYDRRVPAKAEKMQAPMPPPTRPKKPVSSNIEVPSQDVVETRREPQAVEAPRVSTETGPRLVPAMPMRK